MALLSILDLIWLNLEKLLWEPPKRQARLFLLVSVRQSSFGMTTHPVAKRLASVAEALPKIAEALPKMSGEIKAVLPEDDFKYVLHASRASGIKNILPTESAAVKQR